MVEKVLLKWMLWDLEKSVCPSFCPLEGCSYTLNYSVPFLLLWTQRCWLNEWIWFPYLVTSCVSPHPFMTIIENEYSENETIGSCLCAISGEEWKHGGLQAIANSRWGPLSGWWSSETRVHMHRLVLIASQVHVYGRYWKYLTIGILLMSMFRSTQYGCVPTHVLQHVGAYLSAGRSQSGPAGWGSDGQTGEDCPRGYCLNSRGREDQVQLGHGSVDRYRGAGATEDRWLPESGEHLGGWPWARISWQSPCGIGSVSSVFHTVVQM